MEFRPDLKFWENGGRWVVPAVGGSSPRRITQMDPDTTSGLRWLGDDQLVFDRISENMIRMHARIWKVALQ